MNSVTHDAAFLSYDFDHMTKQQMEFAHVCKQTVHVHFTVFKFCNNVWKCIKYIMGVGAVLCD